MIIKDGVLKLELDEQYIVILDRLADFAQHENIKIKEYSTSNYVVNITTEDDSDIEKFKSLKQKDLIPYIHIQININNKPL